MLPAVPFLLPLLILLLAGCAALLLRALGVLGLPEPEWEAIGLSEALLGGCALGLLVFAAFYWHERAQRGRRDVVAARMAARIRESLLLVLARNRPAAPGTLLLAASRAADVRAGAAEVSLPPSSDPPLPPAAATPAPEAPSQANHIERCATLRAEGRFEEAARVARHGLAGEGDAGPLLIELSRAELEIGRVHAAIDIARDAHFASPSRETCSYLIRLLTETRRFAPEDGPALRRAAKRHPDQALLRRAAGVFESMYGEPCAAENALRAALQLELDGRVHEAIERDLARVQQGMARGRAEKRP